MKPSAVIASQLLSAHGVKDVVLSPGSRCAPLVIAMQKCMDLKIHMVVDERAAAFVALGISRQSRHPVALVCTSGTAMLNYAPAVAEAFYQGVPLILLTADRPMQWIDQDDSQTIRQYGALRNVVKESYDIPDFSAADSEMCWYAERTLNEAILTAKDRKPGPVHINCQFNVPLTTEEHTAKNYIPRIINLLRGEDYLSPNIVIDLTKSLCGKRILVVCGYLNSDKRLHNALLEFASLPNVAILPEALANLHLPSLGGVDRILTGISDAMRKQLRPDIVITIGGALLSRMVKEWLRQAPSHMQHWSIDNAYALADCFRHLHLKIAVAPHIFFSQISAEMKKQNATSDYKSLWHHAVASAEVSQKAFMQTVPWCDLRAHQMLYEAVPREWNIYCSNGTSVRYAELFADSSQKQISCNRGTSGIEGATSTAVGAALVSSSPTLLVSGDMSLRHDLAGLALPNVPSSFKVITFANGGGDIFRFIGATNAVQGREEHFACPNLCKSSLPDLAASFGYRYLRAENETSFNTALQQLIECRHKTILEVVTPTQSNALILQQYMTRLSNNQKS